MNFKRAIVSIVLVLLVSSISIAAGNVGEKAPRISTRQWMNTSHPEPARLQGRVYALEFWATWCPPCVKNIPHIEKIYKKYKPKGLEFIALSADRSAAPLARFMKQKNITYPVALDKGTSDAFGIRYYPTVVIVNTEGKVAWRGNPADPAMEKHLALELKKAAPPIIKGVELGQFKSMKDGFWPGSGFAKTYDKVASYLTGKDKKAAVAKRIIQAIDSKIASQIQQAKLAEKNNPQKALNIYSELITDYPGLKMVEAARQNRSQLAQNLNINN